MEEIKSLTNNISNQIDEVIKQIQKDEPDYVPPTRSDNVINVLPPLNVNNLIPITVDQLKLMEVPKIEYAFYPCLPKQGICWIYAATGLGKTLFTLNLSYSIAQGGSFLKYLCNKPMKVLYIDGEMSFNQLHERMMNIMRHQGDLDFPENLSLLTPDKIIPHRMPRMDLPEGQAIYEQLIAKYGYEVIVFDNVSVLSSFDENKADEWKSIQDWLLRLKSIGKAVIVVHHAGKDKTGYRGSSKMLDTADTAISLQPVVEEGLEEENVTAKKFKVVYQKSRGFGGKESLPYEVILDKGMWSYKSSEMTMIDRVVEKLNSSMSQREIAREMQISQSYVHKLIDKARKLGLTPR